MPWLRKVAELVEVVVNDPGATKSGVCMECFGKNGKPVSEVGRPPFHKNCACRIDTVQKSTQPSEVIDEFVGMEPAEPEPPEEGGVEEMEFTL